MNSGLFAFISTILTTVTGDSSQNNWFGGSPRGPISYPNGPSEPPTLGSPLAGDALTAANATRDYYQAIIYWGGNVELARKYGISAPVLTAVEQEIWNRQVAVIQYAMARINAIAGAPPPVPLVEGGGGGGEAEAKQARAGKPAQPKQGSAAEQPEEPSVRSLVEQLKALTKEERAALVAHLLLV